MKRKQRSIFWQPSRVWSGNLKEWKWDGCDWLLLWKPTFPPPPSSSSFSSCPHDVVPPQLPVSPPPRYVCWQNVDETAQMMIATIQSPKAHNTGINISWMRWKIHFKKDRRGWGIFFWHLQQLVTAKLFATSRLSMWGVSLNSKVPNWTIPIRNALYSWSAPLGKSPPENRHKTSVTILTQSFLRTDSTRRLAWTYRSEHWASLRARIPIKPAALKRINSQSFPCPQFRCPHPPGESGIPRSSPERLDPTHIGHLQPWGENDQQDRVLSSGVSQWKSSSSSSSEGMVACVVGLLSLLPLLLAAPLLPAADTSSKRTGTLRVSARRAGDPFSITPTSDEC